jgi:hypothetical protein
MAGKHVRFGPKVAEKHQENQFHSNLQGNPHRHLTIYCRLLFGFFLLYTETVFRLNCLTAQPSYEGRAAVEEGAKSFSKFDHHNINGGAVDNT